jgi:hypothetical protein
MCGLMLRLVRLVAITSIVIMIMIIVIVLGTFIQPSNSVCKENALSESGSLRSEAKEF